MTRFRRLLKALGARELGRRLGRAASTIQRWQREGAPSGATEELRALEARRTRAKNRPKKTKPKLRLKKKVAARGDNRTRVQSSRERERAREREAKERRAAERRRLDQLREAAARKKASRERAKAEKRARDEALAARARAKAEKARVAKERREAKKAQGSAEFKERLAVMREALRLFEDVKTIAEGANVSAATIRRWMTAPPLTGEPFERLREMVETVHRFLHLMKLAGEVGKLPVVRPGRGVRSGRRTEGVYWTRAFLRSLTVEAVGAIAAWIRSHAGNYPYWQAAVVTSQYALSSSADFDVGPKITPYNYKTVFVQLEDKNWGNFAVERIEPSAETTSPGSCARNITERLMAKIESADVQVFVHGVTLFAYRRRSEAEERRWATDERRKRTEAWQRKKGSKR